MKFNVYASLAIVNSLIILLTALSLYITESLWSILILFFMMSTKSNKNEDQEEEY